jgi:hypothetical protein
VGGTAVIGGFILAAWFLHRRQRQKSQDVGNLAKSETPDSVMRHLPMSPGVGIIPGSRTRVEEEYAEEFAAL